MSYPVLDLVAAAEALPDKYGKLKHLILQLRDSHSIQTDLRLANDFIGSMSAIRKSAEAGDAGSIAENAFLALFYSALVLYVRATKTQHDARRSFNFKSDYGATEKAIHDTFVDLRDKNLAHIGDDSTYTGPAFQKEGVFVEYRRGGQDRVFTASHRLVINADLLADLSRIVHRALILSDKRTQGLNNMVTSTIVAEEKASPGLYDLLRKHQIDLADFLGSKEAADVVFEGEPIGYRRGTAKH